VPGPKLKRFHFNVRQGKDLIVDREGVLFKDVGDAITEALFCAQMGRAAVDGTGLSRRIFEIRDTDGKLWATVPII
jgi:hypothetical protein